MNTDNFKISLIFFQDDYYAEFNSPTSQSANSSLNSSKKNLMQHFVSPGWEGKNKAKEMERNKTPPKVAKKSPPKENVVNVVPEKKPAVPPQQTVQMPKNSPAKLQVHNLRTLKSQWKAQANGKKKMTRFEEKEERLMSRLLPAETAQAKEERLLKARQEKEREEKMNQPQSPHSPLTSKADLMDVDREFRLKRPGGEKPAPEKRRIAPINLNKKRPAKKPSPSKVPVADSPKKAAGTSQEHAFKVPTSTEMPVRDRHIDLMPTINKIHGPLENQKLLPPLRSSTSFYSTDLLVKPENIPKNLKKNDVFQPVPFSTVRANDIILYQHPMVQGLLRVGQVLAPSNFEQKVKLLVTVRYNKIIKYEINTKIKFIIEFIHN